MDLESFMLYKKKAEVKAAMSEAEAERRLMAGD